LDVMKLAKKKGIKNIFVTNGFESKECVNLIAKYLDAANIDLKGFTERFYSGNCKARLKPVLETIKLMHKKGIWIELTTLLIPGENDSDKELKEIAEFIKSVSPSIPWHISAFHPDFEMLEKQPTGMAALKKAYDIGKKAGLDFVYIGNIISEKYENTYCPKCGELLVKRVGFTVQNRMKGNKCFCGHEIEGVWK
jgi:pyruvate formate lyase activating enzyme